MAFCTKCGSKLAEDAAFCGHCGSKVKAVQAVQDTDRSAKTIPLAQGRAAIPQGSSAGVGAAFQPNMGRMAEPIIPPQPGQQAGQPFHQSGQVFPTQTASGAGQYQQGFSAQPGQPFNQGNQALGHAQAGRGFQQPGPGGPFASGQPGGVQQFSPGPAGVNFQQPGFGGYAQETVFQQTPGMYVPDKDFKEMFLKTTGRINRKRFIKRVLVIALVFVILASVLIGIMGMRTYARYSWIPSLILGIPGIFFTYCLYVRRLQDLNKDNKLALVTIVIQIISIAGLQRLGVLAYLLGFINFIIWLYLMCKDGTHGPNRYGPDPLNRMY